LYARMSKSSIIAVSTLRAVPTHDARLGPSRPRTVSATLVPRRAGTRTRLVPAISPSLIPWRAGITAASIAVSRAASTPATRPSRPSRAALMTLVPLRTVPRPGLVSTTNPSVIHWRAGDIAVSMATSGAVSTHTTRPSRPPRAVSSMLVPRRASVVAATIAIERERASRVLSPI
jgi:hypothetical protein